jgi:hypothetical protein
LTQRLLSYIEESPAGDFRLIAIAFEVQTMRLVFHEPGGEEIGLSVDDNTFVREIPPKVAERALDFMYADKFREWNGN